MVTVPTVQVNRYRPVKDSVPTVEGDIPASNGNCSLEELDIYLPLMVTVPLVEVDIYRPVMATVPRY